MSRYDVLEILLVWPIVCEAIVNIIGSSELFKPLRDWAVEKDVPFLKGLLICKHCLSVWVAAFLTVIIWATNERTIFELNSWVHAMILVFVIHRFSNIYHCLIDIVQDYKFNRWLYDLDLDEKEEKP